MKECKVNDIYNEHVWISFKKFEKSEYFSGYAYNISNSRILAALQLLKNYDIYRLVQQEISSDWQEAVELRLTDLIPEDLKHPIRIAYIVNNIKLGGAISPVSIDTCSRAVSRLEGHHRLLALKFLGYLKFPVYLGGFVDEIEKVFHIKIF